MHAINAVMVGYDLKTFHFTEVCSMTKLVHPNRTSNGLHSLKYPAHVKLDSIQRRIGHLQIGAMW